MSSDPSQFDEPIAAIRRQIEELTAAEGDPGLIEELQRKLTKVASEIYSKLTPWQKTLVARHPQRPYTLDFIAFLFGEWEEIHGDRKFGDDPAIVAGFARFRNQPCAVIGHQKGRNTKEKIVRNFGQPRPEGFRKALRVMKLAEKFKVPVFTFIDTQGAYPGVGAEERGQAEAIARSTDCCLGLGVPLVSVIIGEGGSGGAIAIATANAVLMLEHAIYSVISPEGAASILWRDATRAKDAASAMRITAQDLKKLGIIDDIIAEPLGGAHRGREQVLAATEDAISRSLRAFSALPPDALRMQRRDKFLAIGRDL